jgi:hypothetical protein
MRIAGARDKPTNILRSVITGEHSSPRRSVAGAVKAIAVAIGGLAGVTAASAGVSALRKREEKARGNS